MQKEILEKFILDPDWEVLLAYIKSHFDIDTSIDGIDTSQHPGTIAAQVVASQKMKRCFDNFENECENARKIFQNKKQPPSYR